jgi:hypothetical protein
MKMEIFSTIFPMCFDFNEMINRPGACGAGAVGSVLFVGKNNLNGHRKI